MNFKRHFLLLLLFGLFLIISCNEAEHEQKQKADFIITNARIWTGNDSQKEAEVMAIAGEKITAIGSKKEVLSLQSETTKVVDMEGRFIAPGFIDSHVHLMTGGRSLLSVDLRDAQTPEEFSKRVADFAQTIEANEWILEGNWDHTLWGGELPHKDWIDEFTKENPVLIMRLDWHMALANSAALKC